MECFRIDSEDLRKVVIDRLFSLNYQWAGRHPNNWYPPIDTTYIYIDPNNGTLFYSIQNIDKCKELLSLADLLCGNIKEYKNDL